MSGRYSKEDLIGLQKKHDVLVGIDSDGCVFDTMAVKQINHFHPLILKHWGLGDVEKEVRQTAEFVNLTSKWRGTNRFAALLKMFDLLSERPDIASVGATLPNTDSLRAYVQSGLPLGNPSLKKEVERTGDAELRRVLEWSLEVNADIAAHMEQIPPFAGVREALRKMHPLADMIVVSQTPEEALVHEWQLHAMDGLVDVIAGQELGTKTEHLLMARGDRYAPDRMLMIGDAPGDQKAAEKAGACFYPIVPGDEVSSWRLLHDEAFDRFMQGTYSGAMERELTERFSASLPEIPPWKQ